MAATIKCPLDNDLDQEHIRMGSLSKIMYNSTRNPGKIIEQTWSRAVATMAYMSSYAACAVHVTTYWGEPERAPH